MKPVDSDNFDKMIKIDYKVEQLNDETEFGDL